MVKQVFYPYWVWEDYKNGLYTKMKIEEPKIKMAADNLKNNEKCYSSMKQVILSWVRSTEHNLSNLGTNRRAWLGQAACCLAVGACDDITKKAWNTLKPKEQRQANKTADQLISWWEKEIFFYKFQKRITDYC